MKQETMKGKQTAKDKNKRGGDNRWTMKGKQTAKDKNKRGGDNRWTIKGKQTAEDKNKKGGTTGGQRRGNKLPRTRTRRGETTGGQWNHQVKSSLLISVLIKTPMVCAPRNLNHVVTSLLGFATHTTKFKDDIEINNLGEPHTLGR